MTGLATISLLIAILFNSGYAMHKMNVVSNNKYSIVQIVDHNDHGLRALMLNRSFASVKYQHSDEPYSDYAIFIEENFIAPTQSLQEKKSILVLGAGGFIIGLTDDKNDYTYVDIDGALKDISEEYFLGQDLGPNKKFVAMDARAYLIQTQEKFDLIVLDLFRDPTSVPENMATQEFFKSVHDRMEEDGVMVANYWASANFTDAYSQNLDHTMRSIFPTLNRQIIKNFNVWKRENDWSNIIYSYVRHKDSSAVIYTDDKNRILYDKPATLPH